MRVVLKSSGRWWRAGWVLPLVLLALPNCAFQTHGLGGDDQFNGGDMPRSSAIMCDIPKVIPGDGCADATDVQNGMSKEFAAVALAEGQKNSLVLDFSATGCPGGLPKKQQMQGDFPDGKTVCLNCGQIIGPVFADANVACVAKCVDLTKADGAEPPGGVQAFCEANAHVSTNFDKHSCFPNACSQGGTPITPFDDPRRDQELTNKWPILLGNGTASENNVSKLTGSGTPADPFDSGAASDQTFGHGDGWVEFGAAETGVSHVIGLTHDDGVPDNDPTLTDMQFALSLNYDGNVYVLENGASYVSAALTTYGPNDRFRIRMKDNNDGTATISYTKLDGMCVKGTHCLEIPLATQTQPSPKYPLRIGVSFREPGATLTNITMVRIKDPQ